MLDIKVLGGKAGKRKVSSVREELELRCLRFFTKFPGNWSVRMERERMKHTFESVSLTKREREPQKVITFWYQRKGSSWSLRP